MGCALSTVSSLRTVEANRRLFWRVLGHFLDAFTIGVSIADIITDVLVMLEFRAMGYDGFYSISLAIFALAQVSYAFLFTATFASQRPVRDRITVFLAALPFGQLVPLFAWLEALHLPMIDRMLIRLGLCPTGKAPRASDKEGVDSLWCFLQSKYQSHAGFLVEAFVEAVPQSMLQTVFVVRAKRVTKLNAVSVAISVFTIASKGYLVSYALDAVTFIFNYLCIVADCLGLFGSATVLTVLNFDSLLTLVMAVLVCTGLALSVMAGHALLWFAIMDDHLKLRDRKHWPHGVRRVTNVAFDLYIVRELAWLLAIIPCIVLFLGAKLALLPICVLKSIDPDMVAHARFFRGLSQFLCGTGGGSAEPEARLLTANTFIARVRCSRDDIELRMQRTPSDRKATVLQAWAANIGVPQNFQRRLRGAPSKPAVGRKEEEEDAMVRAIMESMANAQQEGEGMASKMRARLRHLRAMTWCENTWRRTWSNLQERSEVFRSGFSVVQWMAELRYRPLSITLRIIALLSLLIILICALPLALGHATLVAIGVVFPVVHIPAVCSVDGAESGTALLPCTLTIAYAIVLLCVAVLAPLVARRQSVWYDVMDLRDLPQPFYSGAVLAEIRKRHLRDSMLRDRLGHYLAHHTLSYLEE